MIIIVDSTGKVIPADSIQVVGGINVVQRNSRVIIGGVKTTAFAATRTMTIERPVTRWLTVTQLVTRIDRVMATVPRTATRWAILTVEKQKTMTMDAIHIVTAFSGTISRTRPVTGWTVTEGTQTVTRNLTVTITSTVLHTVAITVTRVVTVGLDP